MKWFWIVLLCGCGTPMVGMDATPEDAAPDAAVDARDVTVDAADAPIDVTPDGPVCSPGLTFCAPGCVDLSTSPLDCGSCGHACNAGEVCAASVCVAMDAGRDVASTDATDTAPVDASDSGSADVISCLNDLGCPQIVDPSGHPHNGLCCGGQCWYLSTQHCGVCTQSCAPGQICTFEMIGPTTWFPGCH